ncbi:MAG: 30S ribosomal protein S17 [Candidatus Caldarchaeum sp.]|uniref:Small ribosomal subunit protein uS17 n=1 Tax=Caldiarchaeum subterraneum TaxID=311458 RepID=A0A7C5LD85_CALS0
MSLVKNIGIPVKTPSRSCDDRDCPFHGNLRVRGILMTGIVIKKKMAKTVVVEKKYQVYVRKFKRYERRRSRISAHLPPCVDVNLGDRVRIGECRPLSKTVSFVVLEKEV